MSDFLWPHGLQHARLPCPSPSPRLCSNSCPLSQWCHPTISSSVIPFFCLQSFPASGPFLMSQLFASGGQNIGASASVSVFPMNIQNWFPLGLTDLISLQSKGLSRVQKHQFFGTQLSLWSNSQARDEGPVNCVHQSHWLHPVLPSWPPFIACYLLLTCAYSDYNGETQMLEDTLST